MDDSVESAKKGWALIWDYLRDKPIIGSLFTAALFFWSPKQITDDAIAERWKNKLKPPRFLIESYLICMCILAVTPFKDIIAGDFVGDTKRHFMQFANVIAYACSVFGGAMVLHFTLNKKHRSAVQAFFAFCYLQGATLLLQYTSVLPPLLIFGMTPTKSLAIALAVTGIPVTIAIFIYTVIVVAELYRPKWYRLILGLLAGFTALVVMLFCFTCLSRGIATRLPN